jgi:transposase InsO family protein/uncharacterized coiled-coil protein SlyX
MPSGVKDIQLLELKDTISQLNKTISTQNELISSLQKMLEERNAKDSEKDLLIANLQSQLAYLKNKVFGSTSEIRHDQLDGQLNLFGTPVGDEKPAEVIEPEVISVKGYTKERKPKATYDDKYNSVRSICKHFFTDIVGLSIKFFCVSLRHMSIWVGDITYNWTGEGWLYTAIVKDLCTKEVVGYAIGDRITKELVIKALKVAIKREKPQAGLIFHSDRGVQYCSNNFKDLLKTNHIHQSMSRKGNPYDNACAENFFSCLKCECTNFYYFKTKEEAKLAIFEYIEVYYNRQRRHATLGWVTPYQYKKLLFSELAA